MHNRGFTLLELLVVIAIIMILAGFLGAVVSNVLEKAEIKKTEAIIQTLWSALQNYRTEWNAYPPFGNGPTNAESNNGILINYLESTGTDVQGVKHGPYILDPLPKNEAGDRYLDAWDNPILVLFPGLDHSGETPPGPDNRGLYFDTSGNQHTDSALAHPDIYSKGPDGLDSTADEKADNINSWRVTR